jgi:hypothetical protein
MHTGEMLQFLRRKLDLLIEHSWTLEYEERLSAHWPPVFDAISSTTVKERELLRLDSELEKEFKEVVLGDDQGELRENLRQEFGLSRLTAKALKAADPGEVGQDVIVVLPRAPRCALPREWVGGADAASGGQEMVKLTATTVLEIAQLFADEVGREVRVARAWAGRAIAASGSCHPDYIRTALISHLELVDLTLEPKMGKVSVMIEGGPMWGMKRKRSAAPPTASATEAEAEGAAADAALSETQFWNLIERAAEAAGGEMHLVGVMLEDALERLGAAKLIGFQRKLDRCMAASYTWELWAVAYIINGGCSDDGFEYFRGWLIARGRKRFEAALRGAERAADGVEPGEICECESIAYAAREVYERKTGEPMPETAVMRTARPSGKDWDEADLWTLYPRLKKRFG